ncbi:MAG: MmgE/PrpD family protein [Bacteroidaceae bacterium]|nr:MmgE/PrpD family protein [Bacteroidaceae bacterium]
MMNLTDRFLQNIFRIRRLDYSPTVESLVRTYLTDTVGVTLAGAADLRDKEEAILSLQKSKGGLKPIGHDTTCSLVDALFINGLSAHFLELDDGVRYGVIHPSAPLFSALIPIAIENDVTWIDFLHGTVCGYETSIRIASALQPYHYSAGYHPTATCCTLGVAVGIAVMLGWEDKVVKDAFAAACISACGSLKVLEDVSQLKPYNCAKAALNGYMSAVMAKVGFTGPSDPLDGNTGFLKMMASSYNEEILTGVRNNLYLEKIYQKPYASCRHTHPEIEACFRIKKMDGFAFDQVDHVKVTTYKGVIGKHDFKDVHGESSARMSIPYSVVIALATGRAGIAEFTEPYVTDKAILNLTQKVDIMSSEELSKLVPEKRVAIVEVVMRDGRVLTDKVEYPKGEPENPLSSEENLIKFLSMTTHAGLSEEKAMAIFNELRQAKQPNFKKLW